MQGGLVCIYDTYLYPVQVKSMLTFTAGLRIARRSINNSARTLAR